MHISKTPLHKAEHAEHNVVHNVQHTAKKAAAAVHHTEKKLVHAADDAKNKTASATEFIKGAGEAVVSDFTMNAVHKNTEPGTHQVAHKAGEVFGHTLSTIGGIMETTGSAAMEAGGFVLDATGVGAIVGIGVNTAAGMAHGATPAATATHNGVKSSKELYNLITHKPEGKVPVKSTVKDLNKMGDNHPRTKEIEVNFKRNPKHDPVEFERQLKAQEEGLNSLTVDKFLENRARFSKDGRVLEGNADQKIARN
ncbi:polymorphic toxin type 15 domain-containing protein [Falsibacillus pallidus]|uniref:polymorphic toxin type 15 domain-containing protein n=1 Tax=Falsibacillus pallidus TaxID=493781 RepID=UPI003D96F6C0